MLLSIIIPVYNEERLVCDLLEKVMDLQVISGVEKEIIVVDDGSLDRTHEVVQRLIEANPSKKLRLLQHPKNRGKGAAVRTGLGAAHGEIVIIQDADLEYDPEDINRVMQPVLDGAAKTVYGSRILGEKALGRSGIFGILTGKHPNSYILAYLGGVTVTKWINLLTGSKLTDEPTCYKCFHRSALDKIQIEREDFSWEPEVTMKILNSGIRIQEVPISYHPRKRSEGKKINWKDGAKALWVAWQYR
ncbi:MAG: glycosyltransferase family 2 protein [Akkermansiaceae bacterium]|nr:glycosyltransferase family 2 protein [Akkermansiaceae bacterium]